MSMNINLNDLNNPNGGPEGAVGGEYRNGLLLTAALFGVGVLRWLWKRDSQKQIQDVKVQYMTALTEHTRKESLEVMKLKNEKRYMWQELLSAQREGEKFQETSQYVLKILEDNLTSRQRIYCSHVQSRESRHNWEKKMLDSVDTDTCMAKLVSKSDLNEIFQKDDYCEMPWNTNDRKNGKLMWVYLRYWRQNITLEKHKKIEEVLKKFKPKESDIDT